MRRTGKPRSGPFNAEIKRSLQQKYDPTPIPSSFIAIVGKQIPVERNPAPQHGIQYVEEEGLASSKRKHRRGCCGGPRGDRDRMTDNRAETNEPNKGTFHTTEILDHIYM